MEDDTQKDKNPKKLSGFSIFAFGFGIMTVILFSTVLMRLSINNNPFALAALSMIFLGGALTAIGLYGIIMDAIISAKE